MKKFLAWMLTLAVLVTCGSFAALAESDSRSVMFDVPMIEAADTDAVSWMASGELRALATILIALDLTNEFGSDSPQAPDFSQPTYVGRAEQDLVFYFHTEAKDLFVMYRPGSGLGGYSLMDVMDDDIALDVLNASCENGCYKNDPTTILSVVQQLQDALNDNNA